MDPALRDCMDCLCLASRQAARAITRRFDRELRPHGLRATQFSLLTQLALRGPLVLSDLAETLGVERTTLTRNLAPVEANGWVASRPGEADARERVIGITPQGEALLRSALPAWQAAQRAAAAAIGADAADALRQLARQAVE